MLLSSAPTDEMVIPSLIQSYSTLFSTFLSIKRKQLSVFDAHYTLVITLPPLIIQLVFASACDAFGIKTDLFERIRPRSGYIRFFGLLFIPLWIILSFIIVLPGERFPDGQQCYDDDNLLVTYPFIFGVVLVFSLSALSSLRVSGLAFTLPEIFTFLVFIFYLILLTLVHSSLYKLYLLGLPSAFAYVVVFYPFFLIASISLPILCLLRYISIIVGN